MAYTVLDNTPSAGCIQWSGIHMVYNGVTYTIVDGYTNYIYTYWTLANPTNFIVSNTFPSLGLDDAIVFLNKLGTHLTVPGATILDGDLIVPGSILASAIAANTITASQIAADTITGTQIAAGAITASELAVGAVTATSIAANAVGANAIAATSITGSKLVAGTITGDKIAAATITANNLVAGTITAASGIIANAAIGSAQIVDASITSAKIASLDAGKITTGTLTAIAISGVTISGSQIIVDGGSYFLVDKGLQTIATAESNLVYDHSFAMVETTNYNDLVPKYDWNVDTGQFHLWNEHWSCYTYTLDTANTNPVKMSPYICSAGNGDDPSITGIFGLQTAVVSLNNYFRQGINNIKANTTYTLSAYHCRVIGTYYRSTTSSNLKLEVVCCGWNTSGYYTTLATYANNTITSSTSWERDALTFTTPANCVAIDVRIKSTVNDQYIYVDGVQLIENSSPSKYDPEQALWEHINNSGSSDGAYRQAQIDTDSLICHGAITAYGKLSIFTETEPSGIEIGKGYTSDTPYIDFHSSGLAPDYDVRVISAGGTATNGAGTLWIYSGGTIASGIGLGNNNEIWGNNSTTFCINFRGVDALTTGSNTVTCIYNGKAGWLTQWQPTYVGHSIPVHYESGGTDGYGVRCSNGWVNPTIWYGSAYCSSGNAVYVNVPAFASTYYVIASGSTSPTAAVRAWWSSSSQIGCYFAGTTSGTIHFVACGAV